MYSVSFVTATSGVSGTADHRLQPACPTDGLSHLCSPGTAGRVASLGYCLAIDLPAGFDIHLSAYQQTCQSVEAIGNLCDLTMCPIAPTRATFAS